MKCVRGMMWALLSAVVVAATQVHALSLDDLSLQGDLQQGGMIIGKVSTGATVEYQKRRLSLTESGEFVVGFGRDEALSQALTIQLADGSRTTLPFTLRKREYNLQRIEGVPAQTVNPDKTHLARIEKEAGQVKVARDADTGLTGFLQSFQWPVQGPITGVYGSQRIYNGEPRRPHFGVDIAAPKGAEIMAPADGVVSLAHGDMFFSGGTMVIDHGHGISTSYLHMSKLLVQTGDMVRQGQVIGLVGASGRATGPHLCWRLNWYQERLDPQLLVPAIK